VVLAKRRHARWASGAGGVTVLWFVILAVAGATSSNNGQATVGAAVLALYVVQVILLFCAPRGTPGDDRPSGRALWLWLSVVPLLGSWLPALAGFRARVWWWVVLGLGCEGIAIVATVQLADSNSPNSSAYAEKLSALWWGAWFGGALSAKLV
jgi:hypothetical protein